MPEIYLVKAEKLIVYDNSDQSIQIVVNTNPLESSYDQAEATIKELEVLLSNDSEDSNDNFSKLTGELVFDSNFLKNDYLNAVDSVKKLSLIHI